MATNNVAEIRRSQKMEQTELATGYRLVVGGLSPVENETGVLYYVMDDSARIWHFNVQYIGGKFAVDTVSGETYYYVDSNLSAVVDIDIDD